MCSARSAKAPSSAGPSCGFGPSTTSPSSHGRQEDDAVEWAPWNRAMSAEDLERFETEIELQLYQEYRDVLPLFRFVVETERRFYLGNDVKMTPSTAGGRP